MYPKVGCECQAEPRFAERKESETKRSGKSKNLGFGGEELLRTREANGGETRPSRKRLRTKDRTEGEDWTLGFEGAGIERRGLEGGGDKTRDSNTRQGTREAEIWVPGCRIIGGDQELRRPDDQVVDSSHWDWTYASGRLGSGVLNRGWGVCSGLVSRIGSADL